MYQTPGPPYHTRHSSYSSGPPPAKKPRGNPIITRYPPPPGYRGPAQPQNAFVPPAWQQQPPAYNPTYPAYAPYPQISIYTSQHFPQAYPPPQSGTYAPSQPGWHPVTTPQSAPPVAWQLPPNTFTQNPPRRHSSAPHANTTALLDGNGDPMPPMDFPLGSAEDLEEAFDGECYFARHPEEINLELSLGLIEWKAPLPTKRAIPSTFAEAELEALAPRRPQPNDDESVSDYFKSPKREEAFLSVRQTEEWEQIRHDLIFREFATVCSEIISIAELLASYRNRFDAEWAEAEPRSPTPALSREATPVHDPYTANGHRGMQVGKVESEHSSNNPSPLDELERALRAHSRKSSMHSRNGSMSSQNPVKLTKPKPLPPVRDEQQEDILAALGVTGSPKLVYQTPGPAFGPPPPTSSDQGQNSRSNSTSSYDLATARSFKRESSSSSSHQPWRKQASGSYWDPPVSGHSHLSADAIEFDPENDNDATPKPPKWKYPRDDIRKRSYADSLVGTTEQGNYGDDEDTPKQKRKQPRVDGAK